jgi:5-methylcytosine-specific restriction enzyme subunit McrC
MRHRTACRFAEFTWDVPENQIVRQVIHALGAWDFRPQLRLRLRRLDGQLAEVSPTAHSPGVLDRMTYHRLNDDYVAIHQFCRLFMEGASLSEDEGIIDFRTFLIDMNRLFESFVTQMLRERAPAGTMVDGQVPVYLGHDKAVPMRIDLLVRDRGRIALVADCKYKRLSAAEALGHDVYQVLAYCTATTVAQGALIYPAHAASIEDEIAVRNSNVRIRRLTIDLSRQGAEFAAECDTFARKVLSVVRPSPASLN